MEYKTVLHIDDDSDDLEIFSDTVAGMNPDIDCISLSSPEEALKKLLSRDFSPEIIFLDINMPYMDGFEFLAAIKKIPGFKTPVVMLSTSSQKETIDCAKQMGAIAYITKPSTIAELILLLSPFFL